MNRIRLAVLAWSVALLVSVAGAEDAGWEAIDALEEKLDQVEQELDLTHEVISVLREGIPSSKNAELAKARQAHEAAEKAAEDAHTAAGLDALRNELRAAQQERDDKAEALLCRSERFRKAVERYDRMTAQIEQMSGRIYELTLKEATELARLRREARHLGRQIYYARRARWDHPEVKSAYRKADRLYGAYGKKRRKVKPAQKTAKRARKALEKVRRKLTPAGAAAATVMAKKAHLENERDALKARLKALRDARMKGAREYSITVPMPPKKGKPRKPKKIKLWMPPQCDYVRGVIVAAPQFGKFASMDIIREAATRADLATMVLHPFSSNGKESIRRCDEVLAQFAEQTGHPELKGAPVLVAGLSASVIAARNLAYVSPDRCFGVVQVAGGNMHHHVPEGTSLTGVPFIAMNGELEWCGPEGGIRPHYGRQTQWVMIREQLLRRWRSDHQHLMSLVVVPGGNHCAWNRELAAMFVRKAAKYRLPKEKRDGSTPAKCLRIDAKDGWLSDADLDNPQHPPAPYSEYTGDKDHAFWHFDEEMARAVVEYHKDEFILPDPTKEHPVPESWPRKRR